MNTLPTNGPLSADSRTTRAGEDTLRLIAGLPAPENLEERLKEGLRSSRQTGLMLMWPVPLRPEAGWMQSNLVRGAAAAAPRPAASRQN